MGTFIFAIYDSEVITQVHNVLTILTYDKLSLQSFSLPSYLIQEGKCQRGITNLAVGWKLRVGERIWSLQPSHPDTAWSLVPGVCLCLPWSCLMLTEPHSTPLAQLFYGKAWVPLESQTFLSKHSLNVQVSRGLSALIARHLISLALRIAYKSLLLALLCSDSTSVFWLKADSLNLIFMSHNNHNWSWFSDCQ